MSISILVVEDSDADFLLIERQLRKSGLPIRTMRVASGEALAVALPASSWDLVLTDFNVPGLDFYEGLRLIQERLPDRPVILVSGALGEERAVELLKAGVWDFVLKDNLTRLLPAVMRAFNEAGERRRRVAAEGALRESEARHRIALDAAELGTWRHDIATDRFDMDERCQRHFGLGGPVAQLADVMSCLDPADAARMREVMRAAYAAAGAENGGYAAECRVVIANAPERWLSIRARVHFEGGEDRRRATLAVGTSLDITALREAQRSLQTQQARLEEQVLARTAELRQAEARSRLILDSSADGLIGVDAGGRGTFVNRAACHLLGYAADELVGHNVHRIVHHVRPDGAPCTDESCDSCALAACPMLVAIRDGRDARVDNDEFWCADDRVIPVIYTVRPMIEDGRPLGAVISFFDISERKRLEQERIEQSRHAELLSRKLVSVQEEERRRLAASLHDRTSPNLAAIKLNLSTIFDTLPLESDVRLEMLLEDTRGLLDDTNASIREISTDMRPTVLDYAGLKTAVEGYAHQFSRRTGIPVRVDIGPLDRSSSPETETVLFRIVQEALTNCAKHANAGQVEIVLGYDGPRLCLTIADDGSGFDTEDLGSPAGAAGLGLLTMRERAEFAGGHFRIDSQPGRGTRIDVEI